MISLPSFQASLYFRMTLEALEAADTIAKIVTCGAFRSSLQALMRFGKRTRRNLGVRHPTAQTKQQGSEDQGS
jgi:hypothetical protein